MRKQFVEANPEVVQKDSNKMTPSQLRKHATEIRKKILTMHYHAKSGHIGSALSCVDILTYLYGEILNKGTGFDSFILSKGHAASAWYAVYEHFLGEDGIPDILKTYHTNGTYLGTHPHPAKSIATGSLGHGLPIATGIAYARKYVCNNPHPVYCLISDGDLEEGSTTEALHFAEDQDLDNLIVIIDRNRLQGFKNSNPLLLGSHWIRINGHNFSELINIRTKKLQPQFFVTETTKGKGVSFMENKLEWHYLPMTQEQYEQAMREQE